jgi:hypothetical protein
VPEQVDDDHAVATLGQRPGERRVHLARQEQTVDQDERARPRPVLVVDQPPAVVMEMARSDPDHAAAA